MGSIAESCLEIWGKDNYPKANFLIGDSVMWKNSQRKLLAMNYVEDDEEGNSIFGYAINDYEYLVWEHELELIDI